MEEKQQRVSHYENLHISAVLQPYPGEKSSELTDNSAGSGGGSGAGSGTMVSTLAETQHCLVCVARRGAPEKAAVAPASAGHILPLCNVAGIPPVEQFTTKLDVNGKIVKVDASGVSANYRQYLTGLENSVMHELYHPEDSDKLSSHLSEALQTGSSTSSQYRLRLVPLLPAGSSESDREKAALHGLFLVVQTRWKRFTSASIEPEFVMATHTICREEGSVDVAAMADRQPASASATSNGNPVLTSIVSSRDVTVPSAASSSVFNSLTNSEPSSLLQHPPSSGAFFGSGGSDIFGDFAQDLFWSTDLMPVVNESSLDSPALAGVSSTAASLGGMNMAMAMSMGMGQQSAQTMQSTPTGSVGGPLLASQALGEWGSPPARPASNSGMGGVHGAGAGSLGLLSSRPSSRQSAASTPRPPSVSAFSPAPNSVLGVNPVLSPVNPTASMVSGVNAVAIASASSSSSSSSSSSTSQPQQQQQPSPASMTTPFSNNFPFSPLQEPSACPDRQTPTTNPSTPSFFDDPRDSKDGILSSLSLNTNGSLSCAMTSGDPNGGGNGDSATSSLGDSARLRILLMQRPPAAGNNNNNLLLSLGGMGGDEAHPSMNSIKREKQEPADHSSCKVGGQTQQQQHDNRILKGLLNQDDEEDSAGMASSVDRFGLGRPQPADGGKTALGGNNMLHKLLNERSDDDIEERMGMRKQNELLKKLLKDPDEDQPHHDHTYQEREEQLLKSLGFPSPSQPQSQPQPPPLTPIGKSPAGNEATAFSLFSCCSSGSSGSSGRVLPPFVGLRRCLSAALLIRLSVNVNDVSASAD